MPFAATLARRVRSGVRRRVDRLLDRIVGPEPDRAPAEPARQAAPPHAAPNTEAAAAPASAAAERAVAQGPQLERDQVEALFEDMVRPALQSDGGDITLIEVRDNDVYVKLLGACETCPSAIMTMQMGIERLLQEEFPHFGRLIRVDDPGSPTGDPVPSPFGTDLGA
jgi:Fe-S cluster biogenesis protein NfuA